MSKINKQKRKQLAHYLGINVEKIQIEDVDSYSKYNTYYTPEGVYYVMDEEESKEAVIEFLTDSIQEMGISFFVPEFQETILKKYTDDNYFKETCKEHYNFYAKNLLEECYSDSYENSLVEECIDNKIIQEKNIDKDGKYTGDKDLVQELTNFLVNDVKENYDSFAQWYQEEFRDMDDLCQDSDLPLDINGIAEECIKSDGYGYNLARYDGKTIQLDTYYAYKIDD